MSDIIDIFEAFHSILESKNTILTEATSNSPHLLDNTSFKWGGGPGSHLTRSRGNWQSDHAWDIMAPVGTPVYAIESGKVSHFSGDLVLRGYVWGYGITITSNNDKFFYTHLQSRNPNLKVGDEVKKGDFLGIIGRPNNIWAPHVHIGIKNNDIKKYIDNKGNILNYEGGDKTVVDTPESNTPDNLDTDSLVSALFDGITGDSAKIDNAPQFDPFVKQSMSFLGKAIGLDESNRKRKKLTENIHRIKKLL
jgi:murein DD-endopeptidase MepM/ murein hydrolase activator NlpD